MSKHAVPAFRRGDGAAVAAPLRMKRGLLYTCCRDNGYNKLVLAQHLDDLAESFIMSALHNGQVREKMRGRCCVTQAEE